MRSYNQARKVLWAGIEALGGLNRIKAVQDFDVTYKEFDSSKGQNTSPKAPDFFVEGGEAQLGLDIAVIAPGHGKVSSISDLRQAVTIRAKK